LCSGASTLFITACPIALATFFYGFVLRYLVMAEGNCIATSAGSSIYIGGVFLLAICTTCCFILVMAAMAGGGRMVGRVRLKRQTGGGLPPDDVRAGTVIGLWILSLMVLAFTAAVFFSCVAWATGLGVGIAVASFLAQLATTVLYWSEPT
jgi:hypothetical protein